MVRKWIGIKSASEQSQSVRLMVSCPGRNHPGGCGKRNGNTAGCNDTRPETERPTSSAPISSGETEGGIFVMLPAPYGSDKSNTSNTRSSRNRLKQSITPAML